MTSKTKVVFVQLGSPKTPKVQDVKVFLKEFLGDPRVVDINPFLWKIILNFFILPFRPKSSAKLYSRIWDGEDFPLRTNTKKFTEKIRALNQDPRLEFDYAYLLSSPRVSDIWDSWEKDVVEDRNPATKLVVIPMFPQYSESTIASGMDFFFTELKTRVRIPPFEFFTNFHKSKAFINCSLQNINNELQLCEYDSLIISFHGIPKRRVIYKGDDYYKHCFETFVLLKKNIQGISKDKIFMTFQSRFGSEEWLTPYTDEFTMDRVEKGDKKIAYYCPSFVADCLETIDEIGHELQKDVEDQGVKVKLIPCLNDDDTWCEEFYKFVKDHSYGTPEQREESYYELEKEDYMAMPEQKMDSPPLDNKAKTALKIVFLTLFLDLVGFSIIFPLFPQLAQHYLEVDRDNFFLKLIFDSITGITSGTGATYTQSIVLFGGALGALYSLLQFIASPLWGGISDRIGRRPVLLISVAGLALSYVLWFFSGSFTLLVLARFIGGIMGGNISTATAVVADVTQKENRSRGMATIGIAFALGFIIGPALGGLFSLIDLTKIYPILAEYGVNPFSVPALIAFLLSAFNFVYLYKKFKETLPTGDVKSEVQRSFNPLVLFKPLPYSEINLTNFGHFLFLLAFSGMEFTLTFLAVERLGYSSLDNAYMFIFIGFIIAFVQGGVVRRKARTVGEKKMALIGLITIIPGLFLIGITQNSWFLYMGLFFLAIGAAMAIPCLTSLVSLYSPVEEQGKSIGIFRSLGALARVIGPLLASLMYWKYGSASPYFLGAMFLIIPIAMVSLLPRPKLD
ncbi:MAG: ferrochelatase [Bacteriovoracaceae bacterium]